MYVRVCRGGGVRACVYVRVCVHAGMCVCACVCVCARVRACVRVYVRACVSLLIFVVVVVDVKEAVIAYLCLVGTVSGSLTALPGCRKSIPA